MALVYSFVPAEPKHVVAMAGRAREADIRELRAQSNATPEEAMKRGLRESTRCWAGLVNGKPVCLFGCAPLGLLGGVGSAWMVGTKDLDRHAKALVKLSPVVIEEMHACFKTLMNFVDTRNDKALRWLKWLGFEIHPPITAPNGVSFSKVVRHV